jgi:uncharacterized RmlC-like cupin family protein
VSKQVTSERVRSVGAEELAATDPTPGIVRELAFSTDRAIVIRARVDGGVVSGWHHHGDRDALGYVVSGTLRFDFGTDGEQTDVEAQGFFHVPRGVVHRDVNPIDEPQEIVIAFVGDGPLVVNVDGAPGSLEQSPVREDAT